MLHFIIRNKKERSNIIKFIKKLYCFKLFNFYIKGLNKWKELEIIYKKKMIDLKFYFFYFLFYLYLSSKTHDTSPKT